MKKLVLSLATLLLVTTISTTQSRAAEIPVNSISRSAEPADVKALLARLDEIKAMDVSNMTRLEKKELRNEVRSTKAALKSNGHGSSGLYISTGAVIIILLLIIIL